MRARAESMREPHAAARISTALGSRSGSATPAHTRAHMITIHRAARRKCMCGTRPRERRQPHGRGHDGARAHAPDAYARAFPHRSPHMSRCVRVLGSVMIARLAAAHVGARDEQRETRPDASPAARRSIAACAWTSPGWCRGLKARGRCSQSAGGVRRCPRARSHARHLPARARRARQRRHCPASASSAARDTRTLAPVHAEGNACAYVDHALRRGAASAHCRRPRRRH